MQKVSKSKLLRNLKVNAGKKFEAYVTRASWVFPKGELSEFTLDNSIKLIRRGLDKLYGAPVVAFGVVKAYRDWSDPPAWRVAWHLVISGSDLDSIFKALSAGSRGSLGDLSVIEVKNLKRSVRRVADRTLRERNSFEPGEGAVLAAVPWRREYRRWLDNGASQHGVFRYGLDRHFNVLAKAPRVKQVVPRKPRANPVWLQGYQFGNHLPDCPCRGCNPDPIGGDDSSGPRYDSQQVHAGWEAYRDLKRKQRELEFGRNPRDLGRK